MQSHLTQGEVAAAGPAEPAGRSTAGEWHRALLHLAGRLPDDLISTSRRWLAEGRTAEVAAALVFAALSSGPIPGTVARLLRAELDAAGDDPSVVDQLEIVDDAGLPDIPWVFAPVVVTGTADPPLLLDLTAPASAPARAGHQDDCDRAAVTIAGQAPVSALWRAWRHPAGRALWPAPRRVLVVDVEPGVDDVTLTTLTVALQQALTGAGDDQAQVEVCPADHTATAYHRGARGGSALLWAAEPVPDIQVARVFDGVDAASGPWFGKDHPRIDDARERERLLHVLETAPAVLATASVMGDVMRRDTRTVVPLTFRTDGRWIWTDTVSYYLRQYSLAPESRLLEHVRSIAPDPPVSAVAMHRVLAFLQRPERAEGAWVVPSMAGDEPVPAAVPEHGIAPGNARTAQDDGLSTSSSAVPLRVSDDTGAGRRPGRDVPRNATADEPIPVETPARASA